MAKKKSKEPESFADHWVCENIECGELHVGVNPPDECSKCGGRYFENMQDLVGKLPRVNA